MPVFALRHKELMKKYKLSLAVVWCNIPQTSRQPWDPRFQGPVEDMEPSRMEHLHSSPSGNYQRWTYLTLITILARETENESLQQDFHERKGEKLKLPHGNPFAPLKTSGHTNLNTTEKTQARLQPSSARLSKAMLRAIQRACWPGNPEI